MPTIDLDLLGLRTVLILDTYNVLHAIEGLGPEAADLTVDSLGRVISRSRYASMPCLLICDGNQGVNGVVDGAPRVQRRFAGAGRDADSEIERLIAASTAPRRLVVVSSDHRIRRAAEKRDAEWVESPRFLSQILKDAERPGRDRSTLSPEDERDIMRAFGVDPEEIRTRRNAEAAGPTGDPTLDEAVRHFGERVTHDDLDMERWLSQRPDGQGPSPEGGIE